MDVGKGDNNHLLEDVMSGHFSEVVRNEDG